MKTDIKHKHLTLKDRERIQDCLYNAMSFKAIAKLISKDPSTVSKEIKKNMTVKTETKSEVPCKLLLAPPFVCNPCRKCHHSCGHTKQFYYAKQADNKYRGLLVSAREGTPLNSQDFWDMDAIVKKGFGKGQHLYQIIKANNLKQSKSAIYNHMKRGWLSADATEFPRMAKFKPRKPKNEVYVPKKAKIGRTYEDFLAFCEQAEITDWVEMDTLIGRVGGKVILTLHFTDANFMIGRLLSNKTAQEVTGKLDYLKGKVDFLELFKVILTDNGSEFADIPGIEKVPNGQIRLFFCDAYKSSQKPHVEKNHTMFRGIAPGGTSFDDWSQETVNLIFSHVNSVSRAMYKGKTSYEMFTFLHSREIAEALEIKEIPALEVIQTPKLLQQLRTKTA